MRGVWASVTEIATSVGVVFTNVGNASAAEFSEAELAIEGAYARVQAVSKDWVTVALAWLIIGYTTGPLEFRNTPALP